MAEDATKRQLVVVVHGVGVKEAGVSADLLATALEDAPDGSKKKSTRSYNNVPLKPHSSDDFHLRELKAYNADGKRQVFPARIRRYRKNDEATGKLEAERVIADFYWGDISNIASGIAGLFLGILKTILGLCHVVRESAWSVFPGDGANRAIRKVANATALAIHGPIAAINVVLLVGVLIHAVLVGQFDWPVLFAAWGTVAISALGGIIVTRRSNVYLTRWFAIWTTSVAIILATLLVVAPINPKSVNQTSIEETEIQLSSLSAFKLTWVDKKLLSHVCKMEGQTKSIISIPCVRAYDKFYMQGLRILGLMGLTWVFVILCNAAIAVAELSLYLRKDANAPPSLVSASISLMSMLWIIMIASIWATLLNLPFKSLPRDIRLEPILGTASFAVIALVAVLIGGLLVYRRTGHWARNTNPAGYIDENNPSHAWKFANANRLIISKWMLLPIWGFFLVMLVTSLTQTAQMVGLGVEIPGLLAIPVRLLEQNFGVIMAGLASIAGILFAAGQSQLRAGLGIAIDVITWLNDHSWNSLESRTKATRTLAERIAPNLLNAGPNLKSQGYWRRERIKDRLKVLMDKLIRDEKPNEIAFVSHSQGTVVAIAVLQEEGGNWCSNMNGKASLKLVTMGSPYSHIHRNYYPASFPALPEITALKKRSDGGVLDDWINIFRIDDFVGTFIDPTGQWPKEHPVPANGHTYYWVDEKVFPILKEFVD